MWAILLTFIIMNLRFSDILIIATITWINIKIFIIR